MIDESTLVLSRHNHCARQFKTNTSKVSPMRLCIMYSTLVVMFMKISGTTMTDESRLSMVIVVELTYPPENHLDNC